MSVPLYAGDHPKDIRDFDNPNIGLWFTRFFDRYESDWSIQKKIEYRGEIVQHEGKKSWISDVSKLKNKAVNLEAALRRRDKLADAIGANCMDFKTDWHFATGLGLSHPVENGFSWHHTLGVPYLAASSVKGLLRGWVEAWMDHDSYDARNAMIHRWFGAVKGESGIKDENGKSIEEYKADSDSAGHLIFFDALPTGLVNLACDIMTPHMGDWYAKGAEINEDNFAMTAPADWHSPNIVPFLVVKSASFQFMIAPRLTGDSEKNTEARQDAIDAMEQLTLALEWIGAGAKTAAGYGRMSVDTKGMEDRAKAAEAERRAKLSPKDKAHAEISTMEESQLKELFSKKWNEKIDEVGESNAQLWIDAANTLHPSTIEKWSSVGKKSDKLIYKAYRRLTGQGSGDE